MVCRSHRERLRTQGLVYAWGLDWQEPSAAI